MCVGWTSKCRGQCCQCAVCERTVSNGRENLKVTHKSAVQGDNSSIYILVEGRDHAYRVARDPLDGSYRVSAFCRCHRVLRHPTHDSMSRLQSSWTAYKGTSLHFPETLLPIVTTCQSAFVTIRRNVLHWWMAWAMHSTRNQVHLLTLSPLWKGVGIMLIWGFENVPFPHAMANCRAFSSVSGEVWSAEISSTSFWKYLWVSYHTYWDT